MVRGTLLIMVTSLHGIPNTSLNASLLEESCLASRPVKDWYANLQVQEASFCRRETQLASRNGWLLRPLPVVFKFVSLIAFRLVTDESERFWFIPILGFG